MDNRRVRTNTQRYGGYPARENNTQRYLSMCKFRVGDIVRIIKPLEVWIEGRKKPIKFPIGSTFTIGSIRLRGKNIPVSAAKSGEIFKYILIDSESRQITEVGQHMFDDTMLEGHERRIKDLKKTCILYKFIIGMRTAVKILLLLAAIFALVFGMAELLTGNSQAKFNFNYAILALVFFIAFLSITLLENIKYPEGLEKALLNKARSKAKLVYCDYDYYNMTVTD